MKQALGGCSSGKDLSKAEPRGVSGLGRPAAARQHDTFGRRAGRRGRCPHDELMMTSVAVAHMDIISVSWVISYLHDISGYNLSKCL